MKKFLLSAAMIATVLLSAACQKENNPDPKKEALTGLFTVDNHGTQIRFSKGNLQYQASTGKWQFATNQYDYIGNAPGNNVSDPTTRSNQSAWIDLIGWSATGTNTQGVQPYSISQTNSEYKTVATAAAGETLTIANKADWGYCMGGASSVWFTLSKDQWAYVMNVENAASGARTQANRFAKANVNGVKGLLLFPDGYTGTASGTGIAAVNAAGSYDTPVEFPTSQIPAATWTAMESAGCVFLPAAGYRDGTTLDLIGDDGNYWSSTSKDGDTAYFLDFFGTGIYACREKERSRGYSIRLVTSAK